MQIDCYVRQNLSKIIIVLGLTLGVASWFAVFAEECPTPVKGTQMVLNTPNGCETYRVGDTIAIAWDLDSTRDQVVIRFSSDNGKSYIIIGQVPVAKDNYKHGPFKWAIPDTLFSSDGLITLPTVSDSCRIKIQEYWRVDLKDISDKGFKILPAVANVKPTQNYLKKTEAMFLLRDRMVEIVTSRTEQVQVSITNMAGKIITRSSGTNTIRLSLERNMPGVYIVKIAGVEGVRVSRFVLK